LKVLFNPKTFIKKKIISNLYDIDYMEIVTTTVFELHADCGGRAHTFAVE